MLKLSRERKPPTPRAAQVAKRLRFDAADGWLSLLGCTSATTYEPPVQVRPLYVIIKVAA